MRSFSGLVFVLLSVLQTLLASGQIVSRSQSQQLKFTIWNSTHQNYSYSGILQASLNQDSNSSISFLVNRTEDASFLKTADAICRDVSPGPGFHYASLVGTLNDLRWGKHTNGSEKRNFDNFQVQGVMYGMSCYDGILGTGKMVCTYKTVEEKNRKEVQTEKIPGYLRKHLKISNLANSDTERNKNTSLEKTRSAGKDVDMQEEIEKILKSEGSDLKFFDIDQNKTVSVTLEWFRATTITCLCDKGYFLNLTENGCVKCPENHYGGGENNTKCTKCDKGTSTFGMEGATKKEDCCHESWYMFRSLGRCVNFVALIAFVVITMLVAVFIVMCGFKMLHEGKDAVDSAEHYPQCRNASRPTVLFRATSFALSARASLLSIVVRPTPD